MEGILGRTWEFHIVLVEPEIPQNTGAIARLCVATRTRLHLVGRLGFHLDERSLRRAGLDYWEHAQVESHPDFESFRAAVDAQPFLFSARATTNYTLAQFPRKSALVFGSESRGLPPSILALGEPTYRIPIYDSRVRSLNLAMAVGIGLYEAIRQQQP